MTSEHLSTMVAHYGYVATFVAVMLASSGIPLPAGEMLIAAAVYAAHTHRLELSVLIAAGSAGAIVGGGVGYTVGRVLGATAIHSYGRFVGLDAPKVRLGRYLFMVHGGKIVFFLRFIALVGPFGGVLAGANRMAIGRFLIFNVLGGIAWTLVFGVGGYSFGSFFEAVGRTAGVAAVVLTLAVLGAAAFYVHRRGADLQAKADAAMADEL